MKQQTSEQLLQQIHEYIGSLSYMRNPMGLYDPIEYVLGLGGKRLRPVLMLLAYNLYKEDVTRIFSQAAGIETYHNFTLLHDDLMDKADMRRNKPTVHKKWDENTAILSGDAMLILAYQFMMKECPLDCVGRVMEVFGRTALEVCEGQQWDMEFEHRLDVTVDEYIGMIRLKTSVLLAAALKIGAVLGGASEEDAQLLYDFGIKMGLAFQLQDDFLDLLGWLHATDYAPEEKIRSVTALYNKVGVPELCQARIDAYYEEGLLLLEKVSVKPSLKEELKKFVCHLMERKL